MLTETCLEREEPADLAPEAAGLARMLTPRYVAKPWGRRDGLPAPEGAQPLGEMIFEAPDAGLTIKWLQTSEPLSVQVHPQGAGRKHEWWHVTEALPGAYLDLGLEAPASRQAIAQAARDGTLPSLLRRIRPQAGDSFYIRAGTIHALGPGLTVLEVQEHSDVTYRLFDYGRPRELHLAQALFEARTEVEPVEALPGAGAPFALSQFALTPGGQVVLVPERACLAVLSGEGTIAGRPFAANQCWLTHGPVALHADTQARLVLAEPRSARSALAEGDLLP